VTLAPPPKRIGGGFLRFGRSGQNRCTLHKAGQIQNQIRVYIRPHILDDLPIELKQVGVGHAHQNGKAPAVKHETLDGSDSLGSFPVYRSDYHLLQDFKRTDPSGHKLAALLRVLQHHVFDTQKYLVPNSVIHIDTRTVRDRFLYPLSCIQKCLCAVSI
jgi:hypothetical protein